MNLNELVKEYRLLQDDKGEYYYLDENGEKKDIYVLNAILQKIFQVSEATIKKHGKRTIIGRGTKGKIAKLYNLNDLLILKNIKKFKKSKKISEYPKLLKEYSHKNTLPPSKILAGTNEKLWWRCSKCKFEWQAIGANRLKGRGCPSCSGHVVSKTNNLKTLYPELAKEYSKKNKIPPDKIKPGTNRKILWECSKCGYEWKTSGAKRVEGTGCPSCSRSIATGKNNLTITNPELIPEYSNKNIILPTKLLAGSDKKVWWKCAKCGHEWQSKVYHRAKGSGCPKCPKKVTIIINDFLFSFPALAKEYSKRNEFPPNKLIGVSKKVWWKCSKCKHEWQAPFTSRRSGKGCPACAGRVVTPTNNLKATHPKLAEEYSTRNKIPPDKIIAGTTKKVWWICSKCNHEWQATGAARKRGSGCPACAGRVITSTNNLNATHPKLAKEYSKHNKIPPDKITAGSPKKVWWKCSKCDHEWQASCASRKSGNGCPACSNKVVTSKNNLKVTHPKLAKEYSKRNKIPPDKIIAGTSKKVWWKCSKCNHEWQATGIARSKGTRCPKCSNRDRSERMKKH